MVDYDFSGWATKNDLECTDGRTILKDAFKHNDGKVVPLVWNHQHNDPNNILGQALLENRKEGVYAYCKFNGTESGKNAKLLVEHGDISALSILANKLKQFGSNVAQGDIKELSLVLAGANPGAFIDQVMKHGEESDDEAIIYTGENISLHDDEDESAFMSHASDKTGDDSDGEETVADVFNTLTEKQKNVVYAIIGQAIEGPEDDSEGDSIKHASDGEETVADVFNTLTEKQKNVVYAIIGQAIEDSEDDDNFKGGNETMKHNVFENEKKQDDVLMHDAMQTILADGKRYGTLKESFLAHAETYGIDNIDYLFPEAKTLNKEPEFIKREMGWVQKVMNGVHHTPFSRIKSMFADITEDDARAKGYIKGKLKKEEVFSLLKRTTTPTTVYKKQKLDRDDVVDITDFDVVAWLKSEMRMMLDEEIARAILVGDGRLNSSDDKINEQNIRPIWTDEDLYTIKSQVNVAKDATGSVLASEFLDQSVRAMKDYKGSGSPTCFMTESLLTECLLLKDANGRRIYKDANEVATAMRVNDIVTVPVMEGLKRTDKEQKKHDLHAIIVNLNDYNVGADKGGSINMFDDFDIDYNQQKYLIETRCSGALTKPYSAIVLETPEEGVLAAMSAKKI